MRLPQPCDETRCEVKDHKRDACNPHPFLVFLSQLYNASFGQ
ncbi:hypothetical protein ACPOL_4221 [Acidisarcina polymorpha]|uniref:Uncharacterized protein n=1 Tax=Acidisarcina polymorpha TaxID=2211140 RepID=A0A2Z5G327_9BACT|nr:hypothetical protein ACPOL_4221 [Acidisarcina polymorpha]